MNSSKIVKLLVWGIYFLVFCPLSSGLLIGCAGNQQDGRPPPPTNHNHRELAVKIPDNTRFDNLIYFGTNPNSPVVVQSVNSQKLITATKLYQEALAAKKDNRLARYYTKLIAASDLVNETIKEYAAEQARWRMAETEVEAKFIIIDEEVFFQFIKGQKNFKNWTEKRLREQFDITDELMLQLAESGKLAKD